MLERFGQQAQKIDEMTPEGRDRYADFLRAASIIVVVLGHWLVAYFTVEDGELQLEQLLAVVPETQWLTWLFQVMPIFFFVGGMANAIGWKSARSRGEKYVNWLRKRARRLLWPVVPLLVFWIPIFLLLDWLGTPTDLLILASQVILIPIWFLAAYMCVVMISPAAYWLHERLGVGALALFVGLAVGVDIAHRSGVPYVGWSNYLWVWGAVHQAGFFWHDGRMPKKAIIGVAMAVVGYGLLVILTHFLGYPLSMVGTGAETDGTNNTPPSIALLLLAFAQIGLVSVFRKPISRWLQRPKVWAPVVLLGSKLMTVYVWHMTAMMAVAAAAFPTGIWPDPQGVTAAWWLSRIPWFFILIVAMAILVFAFGRWERPREGRPTTLRGWPAKLKAFGGVILTSVGLGVLVLGGLYDTEGPLNLPVIGLGMLFAGLVGLGVVGSSLFGRWTKREPEPMPDGEV